MNKPYVFLIQILNVLICLKDIRKHKALVTEYENALLLGPYLLWMQRL